MTVIAAAIGEDGVWIGADTLSIHGGLWTGSCKKWFIHPSGKWGFGMAGTATADAVLLPEVFDQQEEPNKNEILSTMRRVLMAHEAVQQVREDDCIFGDFRLCPIIVTPEEIWSISTDLLSSASLIEDRFAVRGHGDEIAAGAMSLWSKHLKWKYGNVSAESIVRVGVETACRLDHHCGGEIVIQKMGSP